MWPLRRVTPERSSSADGDVSVRPPRPRAVRSASINGPKPAAHEVAEYVPLAPGAGRHTMTTSPIMHWETVVCSDAEEFRRSGDPFPTGELPVPHGYEPSQWREVMGPDSGWSQRVEDLDWFSSVRLICRLLRLFHTAYQACSAEAQKARRVPSHKEILCLRNTFGLLDECVSQHQLIIIQVTLALQRMGRVMDKREQTLNALSQRASKSVHEGLNDAYSQLIARITPGQARVSTATCLIQLQKLDKGVEFFVSMLYSALGQECCTTMYEVRKHLPARRYFAIQESVYDNPNSDLSHQGKCAIKYWERQNNVNFDPKHLSVTNRMGKLLDFISVAYAATHARKHVKPLMAIKKRYPTTTQDAAELV